MHRGFHVLDSQAFMLTSIVISDPATLKLVMPAEVPNPAWLHGGIPSAGQQAWGASLLDAHDFVVFPSVGSKSSWNVVFLPDRASGKYKLRAQNRLVMDTRLNPPAA